MKKGFTLIELIMVLSIMSIVASIALPAFFSMREEGNLTKAQKEVTFLQSAVERYRQEHGVLPATLVEGVSGCQAPVLPKLAQDPWKTDGKNYGYKIGELSSGEDYYVIYTKGAGDSVAYEVQGNSIYNKGGNIIASDLTIIDD